MNHTSAVSLNRAYGAASSGTDNNSLIMPPDLEPGSVVRGYSFKTDNGQSVIDTAKNRPYLVWGVGKRDDGGHIIFGFGKTTSPAKYPHDFDIPAFSQGFERCCNSNSSIGFNTMYALPVDRDHFPDQNGSGVLEIRNEGWQHSPQTWAQMLLCRTYALLWNPQCQIIGTYEPEHMESYTGIQLPLNYKARQKIAETKKRNYIMPAAPDTQNGTDDIASKNSWKQHGLNHEQQLKIMLGGFRNGVKWNNIKQQKQQEIINNLQAPLPTARQNETYTLTAE